MKSVFKPGAIILIIVVSFLLSISSFWLPGIQAANAPLESFSAARAMKHVEQIAQVPHPVGSPAHDIVRDYVITELTKLGLKPQTQKALVTNRLRDTVLSGNVENIWATLAGDNPNGQTISMVAHYDSTKNGPGAADDSMSVGALLETIRALKASTPLHNRVIFLFTDGEEDGLLGAKAFADANPLPKDSTLVLNFEARGNTGPVIMFETGEGNGWFMQEFQRAVPYPVAYSLTSDVYKHMPNYTDFTIFKKAGISGFNFAPIVGFETYHNKFDTPANLNQQTLQHLGSYAVALVKHFGDLELTDRLSGNAVYFTLARPILVLYSGKWVIPLALLAILLFVIVIAVSLRMKIITIKGMLSGFLFSFLILTINAVVGFADQTVFGHLYKFNNRQHTPEDFGRIIGVSNFWIVGLLLLCGLIIAGVYHLVLKRLPYWDLLYGTLLNWAVLTIISSIYLQGASYLFVWPTIMVLVGLILSILAKDQKSSFKLFPLFTLGAATCVLLYTPVIYLVFESMTIKQAVAITVLAALPMSIIILLAAMFMQRPEIETSNLNNISSLPIR